MQQGTVRGFSVSTRCETVEEFIAMFRDRCDDRSIVVNVVEPRVVGTECAFAILLANKKPVLAGTCVVLDVFNDANNPFKRRGMRLGINRLGMDSELVFAQLGQARLTAKRKGTEIGFRAISRAPTMALPIVTADVALGDAVVISSAVSTTAPAVAAATNDAAPIAIARKMTQPMRGLRSDAALAMQPQARVRLPSVQIPPVEKAMEKPLERNVRATPAIVGPDRKVHKRPTSSPDAIVAEGSSRTPGSKLVLPANPFSDVPDASLEGFVECRLFESMVPNDEPLLPLRIARGTVDEPIEDGPTNPVEMPVVVERALRRDDLSAVPEAFVEAAPLEPAPLEPPPLVAPMAAPMTPVPRNRRWIALAFVPAVGAVLAIVALSKTTPSAAPRVEPAITATADDVTVRGSEHVEAAPPAPAASKQPIHAVLIKTYPNAAVVTVGDRSFGTTPTYIKIPGNTPVEVQIVRRGFKPVTRVVTSKRRYDQMFVQLQSEHPRKPIRRPPVVKKTGPMSLSDL
jgi:hypothetical protein